MARLAALPLALATLFIGWGAHAEAPKTHDATGVQTPPTKRPATAMHTTPVHVPARPHALLQAAVADPKPETKKTADKKVAAKPKPPCLRDPVTITRGIEEERFSLTRCDGSAAPDSVAHLSILARPGSSLKPAVPVATLDQSQGPELSPGIKRLDSRLVVRMQQIADHFLKAGGVVQKMHVISGYRPASVGSFHATGRALDFRMDGVSNEDLVAFCKTLPDTGCGYYPNSSFVHLDVRDGGAGHVTWIDASGPGESARYVSTWPPPLPAAPMMDTATPTIDRLLPPLPVDEHPADVTAMTSPSSDSGDMHASDDEINATHELR